MFKWYSAELVHQEEIAPNTRHFWLKAEQDAEWNFRPGQFITFDLPISKRRRQRWRSYSLVNPPSADGIFELCVVRNPEGLGTAYLFDEIKNGKKLTYKGPDGAFFLPKKITKDLVFICTGTGVAPFRSMILDIYAQKKRHQKIHLIFGTRKKSNILYQKEFKDLAAQHTDFQYDVVLSKEDNWGGFKGHVHQIYQKAYPTPQANVQFYLCGWKNMIDEAEKNLLAIGYEKRQVISELYG